MYIITIITSQPSAVLTIFTEVGSKFSICESRVSIGNDKLGPF